MRPQFTTGGLGSFASQGTGWLFSSFPFKNITPGQYALTGRSYLWKQILPEQVADGLKSARFKGTFQTRGIQKA